jgi:hypothetical protein
MSPLLPLLQLETTAAVTRADRQGPARAAAPRCGQAPWQPASRSLFEPAQRKNKERHRESAEDPERKREREQRENKENRENREKEKRERDRQREKEKVKERVKEKVKSENRERREEKLRQKQRKRERENGRDERSARLPSVCAHNCLSHLFCHLDHAGGQHVSLFKLVTHGVKVLACVAESERVWK